jgi:hypothetical protein
MVVKRYAISQRRPRTSNRPPRSFPLLKTRPSSIRLLGHAYKDRHVRKRCLYSHGAKHTPSTSTLYLVKRDTIQTTLPAARPDPINNISSGTGLGSRQYTFLYLAGWISPPSCPVLEAQSQLERNFSGSLVRFVEVAFFQVRLRLLALLRSVIFVYIKSVLLSGFPYHGDSGSAGSYIQLNSAVLLNAERPRNLDCGMFSFPNMMLPLHQEMIALLGACNSNVFDLGCDACRLDKLPGRAYISPCIDMPNYKPISSILLPFR